MKVIDEFSILHVACGVWVGGGAVPVDGWHWPQFVRSRGGNCSPRKVIFTSALLLSLRTHHRLRPDGAPTSHCSSPARRRSWAGGPAPPPSSPIAGSRPWPCRAPRPRADRRPARTGGARSGRSRGTAPSAGYRRRHRRWPWWPMHRPSSRRPTFVVVEPVSPVNRELEVGFIPVRQRCLCPARLVKVSFAPWFLPRCSKVSLPSHRFISSGIYQISRISVHARLAHGQTPSMNLFYSQKKGPAEVFLFSCKIVIKIWKCVSCISSCQSKV